MTPPRSKIVEDDFATEIVRAWTRFGQGWTGRLDWVLDFVNTDLRLLHPEELSAYGYGLLAVSGGVPSQEQIGKMQRDAILAGLPSRVAMSDRLIRRLHRELRAGIRAVLARPVPTDSQAVVRNYRAGRAPGFAVQGWQLPIQRTWLVRIDGARARTHRFVRLASDRDVRGAIIAAVARLIETAGNRLRTCTECGQPFLGYKRQDYCSTECSQVMRNRRKAEKGRTR